MLPPGPAMAENGLCVGYPLEPWETLGFRLIPPPILTLHDASPREG